MVQTLLVIEDEERIVQYQQRGLESLRSHRVDCPVLDEIDRPVLP